MSYFANEKHRKKITATNPESFPPTPLIKRDS